MNGGDQFGNNPQNVGPGPDPARTEVVMEALKLGVVGDLFVSPHLGGIAGGRRNVNLNIDGKESMTRIITRLQGMSLPGVNVNLKQCYEALGDLEKMQKQLAGLGEEVESLDKFFNKKREELE